MHHPCGYLHIQVGVMTWPDNFITSRPVPSPLPPGALNYLGPSVGVLIAKRFGIIRAANPLRFLCLSGEKQKKKTKSINRLWCTYVNYVHSYRYIFASSTSSSYVQNTSKYLYMRIPTFVIIFRSVRFYFMYTLIHTEHRVSREDNIPSLRYLLR